MRKLLFSTALLLASASTLLAQSYGDIVGSTYYDLQSNAACPNRIVQANDGSISIVWIQSLTPGLQPASDRGVGYNYHDGSSWIHGASGYTDNEPHGLASEYVGWPEILVFDSDKELVMNHTPLKATYRMQKGLPGGGWTPTAKLNFDEDFCNPNQDGTWPKAVQSGDVVHMINTHNSDPVNSCEPYSGIVMPITYNRSTDQGTNWDIQNFMLPGQEDSLVMNPHPGQDSFFFRFIGADNYAIHSNGDVVAIVAGGWSQPWVMWKSIDAGLTWNMTTIKSAQDKEVWDFLGQDYYGEYLHDRSHAVVVDDNGDVHCFGGLSTLGVDTLTLDWGNVWFPSNTGLMYWSDKHADMCDFSIIADLVDGSDADGDPLSNMAGFPDNTQNYRTAHLISMPSASVDANGNIYVVYSAAVEFTDSQNPNGSQPTRDLYLVWSNDGGVSWSKEYNIAGEIAGAGDASGGTSIEEDIFPSVVHRVGSDNTLHMTWQLDYEPGLHVAGDEDPFTSNLIMYYGVDVTALPAFSAQTVINTTPNTASTTFNGPSVIAPGDSAKIDITTNGIHYFVTPDVNVFYDTVETSLYPTTTTNYEVYYAYGNACPDVVDNMLVTVTGGAATAEIFYNGMSTDSVWICNGDQVDFTGIAGGGTGTYTYDFHGNVGATTFSATPSATTTYGFGVNGTTSDSIVVVVNALPTADAGVDGTVTYTCEGTNFATIGTAASGDTYLWSPAVGMQPNEVGLAQLAVFPVSTTTYTLTVTNADGCIATDDVTVTVSAALPCGINANDVIDLDVEIFPNPTSSLVNVKANDFDMTGITVVNIKGQVIEQINMTNKRNINFNVASYDEGMYFLKIETKEGLTVKSVVIQK